MEYKDYQPGKPFPEELLPYAWKYNTASRHARELFCRGYSKPETEQVLKEWNTKSQPILESVHITRVVADCWKEYSRLVIPDEFYQSPIFSQLTPNNWKNVAWRELLAYVKNIGLDSDEIEKALRKYIPRDSWRTELKCLLSGYFLLANGEAPVYVIQYLYNRVSAQSIDVNDYDARSYQMRQAITIHDYVSHCLDEGLSLMIGFGMKSDVGLLKFSLKILHNLYLKLVPES